MSDCYCLAKDVVAAMPGDTFAWCVLAVLADDPTISQTAIAEVLGVGRNTVHRAVDRLVESGQIARHCDATDLGPPRHGDAIPPSRDPLIQERTKDKQPAAPDGATAAFDGLAAPVDVRQLLKRAAHAVAAEVWATKNPKPATPFVAVQKIAARFLDAGHDHDAIVAAMVAVPTISIGWVESRLNGGPERGRKSGAQAAAEDLQARIDREFNLRSNDER